MDIALFDGCCSYGNIVWGITYTSKLDKLLKLQKRVVRCCTLFDFHAHSKPLFLKLKVLDIYQLNKYLVGLMLFRYVYTSLPENLQVLLTFNNEIHNYNTRHREKFHIFKCTTIFVSFSFKHTAPLVWNALPQEICQTRHFNGFKRKFKSHLLAST